MERLGKMLEILKTTAEKPTPFGAFHTVSLMLTGAVTLIVCLVFRCPSEKTIRRLLLIVSICVMILELYKQIVFSLVYQSGKILFEYKWHIFPWQFCSTPMFTGVVAAVVKNKKIHYMLCCYLASYGLVAGIFTMISGSSLFSNIIGINIQTMVCHGSMVVVGVFLLWSGYVKPDIETLKSAIPPFLIGAVIAMVLNQAAFLLEIPKGEVFNMYFISPYFPEDQPLLAPIRKILPDPIFQIVYLVTFTALARLVLALFGLLRRRSM